MNGLNELSKLLRVCGGFTKDVKMGGKYYKGLDKQDVLLATIELGFREIDSGYLNDLKDVHKKVRQIIMNKEFKSVEYYIEKLKERVYVRELRKNRKIVS